MLNNVQKTYYSFGQSPWLDSLSRRMLLSGDLKDLIKLGVRGVTTNPSIFEKAFAEDDSYDDAFKSLIGSGYDTEAAYWRLAKADVQAACDLFMPLFVSTDGVDGYVSIEVSPNFAHDTEKTVEQARWLHETIERPNLLVKVPATRAGLSAIEKLTAEGISVNATLIFGLHRYLEVVHAYMKGLELNGSKDLSYINSVASFFISRVDTEIDNRLQSLNNPKALRLAGHAANAQAYVAYEMFKESFERSNRFAKLAARGANRQRPLFASTSTKNPKYHDLLYVLNLIAEDTVNTMPLETIRAVLDHGEPREAAITEKRIAQAHKLLEALKDYGIDFADVSRKLEKEGVEKFQQAYASMLAKLDQLR